MLHFYVPCFFVYNSGFDIILSVINVIANSITKNFKLSVSYHKMLDTNSSVDITENDETFLKGFLMGFYHKIISENYNLNIYVRWYLNKMDKKSW